MERVFDKVIASQSLEKVIEFKIENAIKERQLLPGTKLPSRSDLSIRLGVSRTALTNALHRLEERNLIEFKSDRGIYVKNSSGLSKY
ncbi:winged helix-turn-helix domain-containing protein [Carboxylicivirga sp. RSCT41]|uniref:winged helix-turn-helix domain-containing protein n=1 Tax=Carboxylicivirga agarovorans TaxID=3417570 RepID=UPI003D347B67